MKRTRPHRPKAGYIVLTPEMISALRAERERTGKGPQTLLAGVRDRPDGLNSPLVGKWLLGHAREARIDHLQFILDLYAATSEPVRKNTLPAVELRPALRRELRRTRTSDDELRRMLSMEQKKSWQFLPPEELAKALELLRALPSGPKPPRKKPKPRKRLPWLEQGYFWEKRPPQS